MKTRDIVIFTLVFGLSMTAVSGRRLKLRVATTTTPQPYSIEDPKNFTLLEKLGAAEKKITRVSAVNDDFRNKLASQFNWEHLLSPAPLSIAVLGDLMIVASNTLDFPINVINTTEGFQYMKYPNSFRASLVQISNSGYTAFNRAHTNMDKIRLYTMNVPSYIKQATRILLSKQPAVIESLLPLMLQRIEEVADQSVILSLEVVSAFESAINLTGEVLEACTATKGDKEIKLADILREKNITELELSSTGELLNNIKADKDKYEKMVDDYSRQVQEAIRKMPSGWKIIGMNIVEGLGNIATLKFNKLFGGYASSASSSSSSTTGSEAQSPVSNDERGCLLQHKQGVYRHRRIAESLVDLASSNFTRLSSAAKGAYKPERDLKDLDRLKAAEPHCEALRVACDEMAEIIQILGEIAKTGDLNETNTEEIIAAIQKLGAESQESYQFVQTNSLPVPSRTPGLSELGVPAGARASDIAVSNARFAVKSAQENLRMAMESADKTREKMIEINKEYIDALTRMQRLKVDEIRFDEAIKLLQEGLVLLSKLKEHWSKLVRFFQQISNIVQTVMSVHLKDFVALSNRTSTQLITLEFSVTLDLIYESVLKASQATYLVNNMADMYTQVSNQYIMDNVVRLNRLIAFDAAKEGTTIAVKRQELLDQCKADSEKIIELVMAQKSKLIEDMQGRMQEITQEYEPIFQEAEQTIKSIDFDDNEIDF